MTTALKPNGMLTLKNPVDLPDVLDLLVVGGGPSGTAAAFRAKELGLDCLVLEFDGLLKRIRDYPKDKLILPSFGGGDKMKFPAGGDLVKRLYFEAIDKDDLVATWSRQYEECSVPAMIGTEFTGLERDGDVWSVLTWNHKTKAREVYRARHVALALGRGVPRRFDIPGNTDGVSYKLQDAGHYLGRPALVVGGGTSAAEAVIAISNTKVENDDVSAVYWSYRGSKMPRVSKALAEVFFEAYMGNGNIRYHPHSEPVAIVVGPDRNEYVSLRVVRRAEPGMPQETVHLEFQKEDCIACIGEDVPEALLKDLGIDMVVVGEAGKKMMAVTPLLETQVPQLYLIGDLLSQAYLETTEFNGSPEDFQRMKHKGNIKQAMRDGVFLAEVVRQRVDGKDEVAVVIHDADEVEGAFETDHQQTVLIDIMEQAPESFILDRPVLVRMTPAGVDEEEYPINLTGVTTIGQKGCDLNFPDDSQLSESHASILYSDGTLRLRDDGGAGGTFLKLQAERPASLATESILRLGRQIVVLRKNVDGRVLHHYDARGQFLEHIPLVAGTTVLGRSGGKTDPDISLGDEDRTLSRFHLGITVTGDDVVAEDFNSSNGTYLKINASLEVSDGDIFRMGGQIFRVQITSDPSKTDSVFHPTKTEMVPPTRAEATPPVAMEAAEEPATEVVPDSPATDIAAPELTTIGGAQVSFSGHDTPFDIEDDQSVLDIADEHDIEIDYECWCGLCGCDLIRVIEGQEHLNEISDKELKTLKRKGVEPGEYRLACMTKVSGPVRVEVVD